MRRYVHGVTSLSCFVFFKPINPASTFVMSTWDTMGALTFLIFHSDGKTFTLKFDRQILKFRSLFIGNRNKVCMFMVCSGVRFSIRSNPASFTGCLKISLLSLISSVYNT